MALRYPLYSIGLAFMLVMGTGALAGADETGVVKQVVVLDECEQTSFNATFGDGICINVVTTQGVPLPEFLGALPAGHPQWLFYPATLSIKRGDTVRAVNQGGEVHTFTEVKEFGGGFLPPLNDPPNSAAVPECAVGYANISVASTRVIQGSSLSVTGLRKGVHHFQCCIHPWMRMDIEVN
jgi:plastocyanin